MIEIVGFFVDLIVLALATPQSWLYVFENINSFKFELLGQCLSLKITNNVLKFLKKYLKQLKP